MRTAIEKGAVTYGGAASNRQRNEWMSMDEAFGDAKDTSQDWDNRSDSPDKNDWGDSSLGNHDDWEDNSSANAAAEYTIDDGGPPVLADGRVLIIFDVNGVLIYRGAQKNTGRCRPCLDELLEVLDRHSDRFAVAVWSSMAEWNLRPLAQMVFKDRVKKLLFIWDQRWCTQKRVKTMTKPLMRKDLIWVKKSRFGDFHQENVLLIDDAPLKCTENPKGTAIHPTEWVGDPKDKELRTLAAYLDKLGHSRCRSSRKYVLENAFTPGAVLSRASSSEPAPAKRQRTDEPISGSTRPKTPPRGAETNSPWNGWRRVESRSSPGVYYYFNDVTKESAIEPPAPWDKRESRSAPGAFYYWNPETKVTSVEKPDLT